MVRTGSAPRVLDWMERTRAAALLAVEPPGGVSVDDLEALRSIHAELETIGSADRMAAAGVPEPVMVRLRTVEDRIRRASWHRRTPDGQPSDRSRAVAGWSDGQPSDRSRAVAGWSDGQPSDRSRAVAGWSDGIAGSIRPARLRDRLGGRVLVEYAVLNGILIAVVVERRRSRLVTLGPAAAVLDQVRTLFFALRRMTQPLPESSLAAARLSADSRVTRLRALLLRPLDLPADAELVIVPVGDLHGIPWSALCDTPVSLAPSAALWARTSAADPPGGPTVLVEGPALAGATTEVARLRELYPAAVALTPPESTAAAVLRHLDGAGLVHLACHGRLRADNPMFSSLVLSDGPLTVQELQTSGVAAHRLVLASCQSGADVSYAGDEVVGFISSVLARGTAGVVASVAAVPDVAAIDLMSALHRHLVDGRTLAHALHTAREGLDRTDPAAYVNWCTFTAYGAA
jgi:hypothetical protein